MDWIIYIFKVGIIFILLYSVYFFLFRKSTFFQLNRLYLLGIAPLSFFLPIVNESVEISSHYQIILPTIELLKSSTADKSVEWVDFVAQVYIAISTLLFAFLIFKTIQTLSVISKVKNEGIEGVKPFSFFHFIYIPKSLEKQTVSVVLAHEKVHSTQIHSIDIYVYELTKVILWWNPFVWIALKSVKNNHEFIADTIASKKSINYSSILVAQLLGVNCSELANNFNYEPFIKKRIMMIKTKKSKRLSVLKYALAIPVIAVSIAATTNNQLPTNRETLSEKKNEPGIGEVDIMPEFKGGMDKLMEYLSNTVKYPKDAEKSGIEGTVYVNFLVAKDGGIKNVTLAKSVNPLLDAEAVRVITEMPKWNPGTKDGKVVEVEMVLPIAFRLNNN